MYKATTGPRAEYREQQSQRVKASPSLAEKYQKLKSLTVNFGYYAPQNGARQRQLTYDVNLGHAKSVFRIECTNDECIRGDFDLTEELAKAVAKKRTRVEGELCCDGWQSKARINQVKCQHILRYNLKLAY